VYVVTAGVHYAWRFGCERNRIGFLNRQRVYIAPNSHAVRAPLRPRDTAYHSGTGDATYIGRTGPVERFFERGRGSFLPPGQLGIAVESTT
jgi:hypothetical protein